MRRLTTRFNSGIILSGILLFIGGCAASLPYQKAGEQGGPGYFDKHEDTEGAFQIDYVAEGRNLAYAKYAAYYRAAELAYETGYRYFIVTKAYDLTKKGKAWGDPKNLTGDTPGVRIFIQCYKTKPAQAAYDTNQYLNTAKVPGSEDIYSTAQRHGDQSTQEIPK